MSGHTSHWHGTTSVPGPVDPDGCCKDQPTWVAHQKKDRA